MSEPISAAISAGVKAARASASMTREELTAAARTAGAPDTFTSAALRNIESGRRSTSVDELLWLAGALGVPVRQLLGEHADAFGVEAPATPPAGPVEDATRRAVETLGELTDREPALAEAAFALAGQLDSGAGMAAAAIAKELRAQLAEIWDGRGAGDDGNGFDPE